ncbi:MAG: aminotransferase class IV family protein [Cypionkella sp.]|uniref:aminotransferase class IV family protein n=1 Tax=Cypionkella sp. TaxID=2811411 RepID=UPI002ABA4452|nr:aminotransferase class IV family protein [Cypionkella sp.]MDZ4311186.1 aminotransferase class IV family protein [Cypionkella sp.]
MESALLAGAGAAGLKLIETLAWDGAALVRLPLHLARLRRSAQALGWGCDLSAVEAALMAAVPVGAARMRLTLESEGRFEVQAAALPAGKPEWRVGLATTRLTSDDPWLTVKSTNRAAYDAARANLPDGLDEVIFRNERGEVCDASITTVFFDQGDGLCTPPLSCGLLPGVLRAEMLAAGAVREAVLRADDLENVRLWLGNSLRGLIPALFVQKIGA